MTMAENKDKKVLNVPNLRFPEFEGEWEKKRLGDFTERVKRKNKYNLSKLPLTISAKYGLVDQITFFNKIVASTDMSNYYLLKKGEFAYNKSYSNDYPWGAIKRLDNYEQGVLSALYICFATQDNVESDFILQYFESPKWHKSVSEIAVEGARNHGLLNISVQDFFQTYHYVPKEKKEQTKIATLLHLIDERISTQNKIIEKLETLIKGICNNYFLKLSHSQEMKSIRLGDILKERNEYCCKDGTFVHGTLSKDGLFPKTERWNRDFLVKEENKKYKITHLDDICYNPANLKFGVICRNIYGDLIFSPIYVTFEVSKKVNIGFIELYLTNRNFIEKIRKFEQGTVYERMSVSPEDFLSYKIRIPSLSEQTFFYQKIQRLKNCSQNELEHLNLYKKLRQYLLRQMFI